MREHAHVVDCVGPDRVRHDVHQRDERLAEHHVRREAVAQVPQVVPSRGKGSGRNRKGHSSFKQAYPGPRRNETALHRRFRVGLTASPVAAQARVHRRPRHAAPTRGLPTNLWAAARTGGLICAFALASGMCTIAMATRSGTRYVLCQVRAVCCMAHDRHDGIMEQMRREDQLGPRRRPGLQPPHLEVGLAERRACAAAPASSVLRPTQHASALIGLSPWPLSQPIKEKLRGSC